MARLGDWLDARLGYRQRARAWLEHPVLGGAPWAAAMGRVIGACFLLLAATGVLLMTAYAPTPQAAWPSVHYLTHTLPGGWVLRGVHCYTSHALVVLVGVHLVHLVARGAYRRPNELAMWLAIVFVGLVLGEAITGHLLPWDQRGFWARKVEYGIVGMAPGVGAWLQRVLQGGPELGALGLTRAYAAHVAVLPALFALAWALFARASRPPVAAKEAAALLVEPYARALGRALALSLAILAVVVLLAFRARGAPLEAPADPASDYPARPEWFLMPLYQLRRLFSGSLEFWGTALVPLAAVLYLFALPFLDKKPDLRARVLPLAPFAAMLTFFTTLGVLGSRNDARDRPFLEAVARADARARAASDLAKAGVPASGPLDMLRRDPELRGEELFVEKCATCHELGGRAREKATAPSLDGWGTTAWIERTLHAPDADDRFGRTGFKGKMDPVDEAPKAEGDPPQLVRGDDERRAVARFLAAQGDEPGDPGAPMDEATRALGESIVATRCTGCHLWKGEGDDQGSGYAPELSRYGSLAWTREQIRNPSSKATYREKALEDGLKGHMPRFDDELSPADVDLLARWVRAKARGIPIR